MRELQKTPKYSGAFLALVLPGQGNNGTHEDDVDGHKTTHTCSHPDRNSSAAAAHPSEARGCCVGLAADVRAVHGGLAVQRAAPRASDVCSTSLRFGFLHHRLDEQTSLEGIGDLGLLLASALEALHGAGLVLGVTLLRHLVEGGVGGQGGSSRQVGLAHQEVVDTRRAVAALCDSCHHQGGPAAAVTTDEQILPGTALSLILSIGGQEVGVLVALEHAGWVGGLVGAGESHGQNDKLGRILNGAAALATLVRRNDSADTVGVVGRRLESLGADKVLAGVTAVELLDLGVRVVHPVGVRPARPGGVGRSGRGRHISARELEDTPGAQSHGGRDAIDGGVTTSDDDDALTLELVGRGLPLDTGI
mmetsp:Transcript_27799/g.60389  ORF Transcript_27799/g.60389 Transcript_27799/m.60389 type:complete len:363 (-) Transcript_27799:1494-2582(-)